MTKNIRLLAQYYDTATNEVLEEALIEDEIVLKAEALRDLGYDHKNQVDYLQKMQDFKLKLCNDNFLCRGATHFFAGLEVNELS